MLLKIETSKITSFFYNNFFLFGGGFKPPKTPPAYATLYNVTASTFQKFNLRELQKQNAVYSLRCKMRSENQSEKPYIFTIFCSLLISSLQHFHVSILNMFFCFGFMIERAVSRSPQNDALYAFSARMLVYCSSHESSIVDNRVPSELSSAGQRDPVAASFGRGKVAGAMQSERCPGDAHSLVAAHPQTPR